MDKIKRCPFCGSSEVEVVCLVSTVYCVTCKNCGAMGPRYALFEGPAVETWNRAGDRIEKAREKSKRAGVMVAQLKGQFERAAEAWGNCNGHLNTLEQLLADARWERENLKKALNILSRAFVTYALSKGQKFVGYELPAGSDNHAVVSAGLAMFRASNEIATAAKKEDQKE